MEARGEGRLRRSVGLALTAALAALAPIPATAAAAPAAAARDRILVGYEPGVNAAGAQRVRSRLGLERLRPLRIGPRADLIRVAASEPRALEAKAKEIAARPGVAWAQPDYLVELHKLPRDGIFARSQWGLRNVGSWTDAGSTQQSSTPGADIDAPLAWDVTTGHPGVTVGVVDSGVYAGHREFQDGRVLPGRDFIAADNNPDDQEPTGHGSHVAGIIGARADGAGTVGVSWDLRLLAVRAVSAVDAEPPGSVVEALAFAADRGASVVNMSFGSQTNSQPAMDAVFASHPGTLFVASAGNGGPDQVGDDNDADPMTPCSSPAANVVCVASTTDDDLRSGFSNFGRNSVDLAAPGSGIISVNGGTTRTPTSYRQLSGTSMAAPHVSGIAALLRAGTWWRSTAQIKACILAGADRVPALTGITVTGGRANARRALDACADRTPPERAATLVSPAPGVRVRSRNARFQFAPGGDSESGLARSELLIDGRPFPASAQGSSAFAPAVTIAHGAHTWTIRTIDRSGNARDAGTRAIRIDNRGPKARVKVLSASAKRGVLLRVKLDERARKLSAATVLSRKVRKRIGSKRRTLAGKVRRSLKAGTRKVRVKLPAKLRKRGRGQRVKLTLKLTDALGNTARKSVSLRLRR